jgi:hypothetical protein
MTTRKQMLKIKVRFSYQRDGYSYSNKIGSLQGMSEAKVEKIKVRNVLQHICAPYSGVHRKRRTK